MPEESGSALALARTRFVATMPRKAAELWSSVERVAEQPRHDEPREELRRRLHALYASAQVFRIPTLSEALRDAIGRLDSAREGGHSLESVDIDELKRLSGALPDLAGHPSAPPSAPPEPSPSDDTVEGVASLQPSGRRDSAAALHSGSQALRVGAESSATSLAPLAGLHSEHPSDRTGGLSVVPDLKRSSRPSERQSESAERQSQPRELQSQPSERQSRRSTPSVAAASTVRETSLGMGPPSRKGISETTVGGLVQRIDAEVRRELLDFVETGKDERFSFTSDDDLLRSLRYSLRRIRDDLVRRTSGRISYESSYPEEEETRLVPPELADRASRSRLATARKSAKSNGGNVVSLAPAYPQSEPPPEELGDQAGSSPAVSEVAAALSVIEETGEGAATLEEGRLHRLTDDPPRFSVPHEDETSTDAPEKPASGGLRWMAAAVLLGALGFGGYRMIQGGVAEPSEDAPESSSRDEEQPPPTLNVVPPPNPSAVDEVPGEEITAPSFETGEEGRAPQDEGADPENDSEPVAAATGLVFIEQGTSSDVTEVRVGDRSVGAPPLETELSSGVHRFTFISRKRERYRYWYVRGGQIRTLTAP